MSEQPEPQVEQPQTIPETRAARSTLATMPTTGFGISPTNFDEAWRLAQMLAKSNFAPEAYRDKPQDCLFAMAYGAEIGLSMLQAIQGIAVINGRPSVWGDSLIGIVRANSSIVSIEESIEGEGENMVATCILTRLRNGREEVTKRTFSVEEAKKAGLWGKRVWATYPKRMLQMRARGFTLRDGAADILKGIIMAEEAMDIPMKNVTASVEEPLPPSLIDPDNFDERDDRIQELLTKTKWTKARIEIEWKACDYDKAKMLERLERDFGNIGDRKGRASHAQEITSTNDSRIAEQTNAQNSQKMEPKTRNHLFAILTELELIEKPKRLEWAENHGVKVSSFSELTEEDASLLLALAQSQLAAQKSQGATEISVRNNSTIDCEKCGAKPMENHSSDCPELVIAQ